MIGQGKAKAAGLVPKVVCSGRIAGRAILLTGLPSTGKAAIAMDKKKHASPAIINVSLGILQSLGNVILLPLPLQRSSPWACPKLKLSAITQALRALAFASKKEPRSSKEKLLRFKLTGV